MDALQQDFHNDMMEGIDVVKKRHGYNPTYFLRMVSDHGALGTARLLLASPDAQEGLTTLWELNALDYSVEAQVCLSKYRSLFTDEERRVARDRLKALGYEPKRR